jgi:hypothetical protein
MGNINRYQELLMAALSHARSLGVQPRMEGAPVEDVEPFVIGYQGGPEGSAEGVILLFPPVALCLNSAALAQIAWVLRDAEIDGRAATLVFSDEALRSLRNVLCAAAIPLHASIQTYVVNRPLAAGLAAAPRYIMDWVLPNSPLPGSNPQLYDTLYKRPNA